VRYFLIFVFCSLVYAESFKILGPRAIAMGGAQVACTKDSFAQYWNPAALGIGRDVDVEIPFGIQGELTGDILGSADRISQLVEEYDKITQAQEDGDYIGLTEINSFVKILKEIDELNDPSKGVLIDASGGANFRISHLAFSVNNFTSIGVDPAVDTKNIRFDTATVSGAQSTSVKNLQDYQGIDLGKLIDDFVSSNPTIDDDPSDPDLLNARDTLLYGSDGAGGETGILEEITDTLGADFDESKYTLKDIANAIINAATDPTIVGPENVLTEEEVVDYVNQVEELKPTIEYILDSAVNGGAVSDNQSNLTLRGTSIFEAAFGYGMKFPNLLSPLPLLNSLLKGLYVGGNIKFMKGYISYYKQMVFSEDADGIDLVIENYDEYYRTSNALGIDLGFLYEKRPFGKRIRAGLVARNINSPTFDAPPESGSSQYKVRPQLRAGIALWPFNWWVISSDIDLSENSTALPGYKSRYFGLGTEINILNRRWLNLALRAGLMKNIAEATSKLSYTAGFGLNILHFNIDLGAAMSTDKTEIEDGTEIPSSASASLMISFNF